MNLNYTDTIPLNREERIALEYEVLSDEKRLLHFIEPFLLILREDIGLRIPPEEHEGFLNFLRKKVCEVRDQFYDHVGYKDKTLLFSLYLNLKLEDILMDWEDRQK